MECLIIGRDLVRLLQNVARIPEMELVWKDLLHNPQVLSPQFTGMTTLPTVLRVQAVLCVCQHVEGEFLGLSQFPDVCGVFQVFSNC